MLQFISQLSPNQTVGGVHCVPILENGNVVMVWDRKEKVLTTIGGRMNPNETIMECLDREVREEAGIELTDERILFASWYWKQFDAYRLFYLVKVKRFIERPEGFETTGYVIANFETAIEMIRRIEGRKERIEVIRRAGILAGQLKAPESGK
ncbi:MAG: hypothetical protein K0Q59_4270 [Paenibacillus sp.]|jgi:8-oxo-dGTP pyrophosphatase MutT (NUDIX family)|nr:hypothetical protein [Paenibacillus sp.]